MITHAMRLAGAITLFLVSSQGVLAQDAGAPSVTYASASAISPRLSDLPAASTADLSKPPRVRQHMPIPHGTGASAANGADSALQAWVARQSPAAIRPSFPGIGATGFLPPDPNIAVGPAHIVQVVNTSVAVYDKNGNLYSGYPKRLSSIWTGLSGGCSTNNAGDPVAQYDRAADRWVLFQLGSLSAPYSQCIAVSVSGDPTGAYYLYSYDFGSNLNDYSKFGIWPTATNSAYLGTYNLFANGASFVGAALCVYDRAGMLSGAATPAQVCFTINGDGGYLPSDLDGATAPPDGTPGYFLNFFTLSSLRLYKIAPNFASPGSTTLSAATDFSVASFSEACGGGTCVPQPNTGRQLDSLGDRLMYRLAYRNFGDHEAMVVNHSVAAGSAVGVRWYELRKTPASSSGSVSLYQQGTYAPGDGLYRWMGSTAMDKNGNIALGYSASSSSTYPSIRVTTRAPTDPLGTMNGETTVQNGGGSQNGSYSRWGDYTAMRVDPTDDCTFWYTNEYYATSSSYAWSTFIGSLQMPGCSSTSTPTLSITETGSGTGTVTSNPSGISCPTTCSASFTSGTQITLSETPGSNSTFAGWSGGGCSGTGTTCSLTLSGSTSVSAAFNSTLVSYTLSVSKNGAGSVTSTPAGINCGATCSASYASGTSVTLTAKPNKGHTFRGWGGACSGSSLTCTVAMTTNVSVSATFR